MASRVFAVVVLATLLSFAFASTTERTVDLTTGTSATVDLEAYDNVYITSNTDQPYSLTFTTSFGVDLSNVKIDVPAGVAVYYLSRALWCGSNIADETTGTLTVSYVYNSAAANTFTIGVVSDGSIVLDGAKSLDQIDYEEYLCVPSTTPLEFRDIYLSVADVEDESHFRVTLRSTNSRITDVYAEDGSCPGTECPQEDDFNDDKCEFAARSEGSSSKHEINSLWSPEGRWWFRARLASCNAGDKISVGLDFSNAFAAKASAALIAVLAAVAMLL